MDDNNSNTINELDIADGLKHILISHGVTVEALLNTSPMMIATMLGIDQYVANIIQKAPKYYYITGSLLFVTNALLLADIGQLLEGS
jgi:hypothetical protein